MLDCLTFKQPNKSEIVVLIYSMARVSVGITNINHEQEYEYWSKC